MEVLIILYDYVLQLYKKHSEQPCINAVYRYEVRLQYATIQANEENQEHGMNEPQPDSGTFALAMNMRL